MVEDYKKAALEIYPVKWSCGDADASFRIDNNAGRRAVAEEVFKYVFDKLKSETVAASVSEAFLRRILRLGADNKRINAASMSTALMAAIIIIRDNE